ncbi:MAG TPA: cell division protein FtsZ, partial [Baekduia sp.]|nr:cell division protein FtsZ [Baekduia sp.]
GAMVDETLGDQVWVTVVATRYGEPRRRRRPLEEPAGEPRVERRSPARVAGPMRGAADLDVPEFLPRR